MRAIGVMSGSSLDGLDLALCSFDRGTEPWGYFIEAATTVPFDQDWHDRLLRLPSSTAFDLSRTHRDFGVFIGTAVKGFMQAHGAADLIASHGHTVFHQPGPEGFTTQIGCGAQIAAITGTPAVVDFRTMDIALGGQGAPLVPMGERLLFRGYDAFINLGGIANISFHAGARTSGYDICTCNQALNALAAEAGKPYDDGGGIARSGDIDQQLLQRLNDLPFVRQPVPRSLGRELFEQDMLPLIHGSTVPLADRMRTCVEHMVQQVAQHLERNKAERAMVTGGGAHNAFFVERLRSSTQAEITLPDALTINFKEALVFALLGALRWHQRANTLSSVTGAVRDSIGGAVYLPN